MRESRIRILSPAVASRIAAGETIERPVSVLKELIDNALDAGASQVTIQVEGSLDRSLTVTDDGEGMTREDAELSIRRHSTSKINEFDDLFRLRTLGFRGEALPSIAAVSAMVIRTCPDEGAPGTEIEVVGGELLGVREIARARGTSVQVRDLFFNVPVRRRFMKTERGELRAALRLLAQLALARPGIRFVLERSGAPAVRYDPVSDLRERASEIFGRGYAQKLLPVDLVREGVTVEGLVGVPEQSRATRDNQVLIVNGRPVTSPLLGHAARVAYGDLIAGDRQPSFVLVVSVDPSLVDVNVHPTKREVKFAREGEVFGAVRDAVLAALASLSPVPRPAPSGRGPAPWHSAPRSGFLREPGDPATAQEALAFWSTLRTPLVREEPEREEAGEGAETPADEEVRKIWQLHRRYIFAQTQSGLLIIDQHAAHERILYERALMRLDGSAATSQRLLFPETIELTHGEMEIFGEIQEELRKLGFEVEPFGERTLLVRSIPDDTRGWDHGGLLHDMLDEFTNAGRSIRTVRERVARAFACRAAVKGGTRLSVEEMHALIDALFATSRPHGDPHGRPTLIQIPLAELDRRFGRS
jgi:DNA mismatch repair protein MutL